MLDLAADGRFTMLNIPFPIRQIKPDLKQVYPQHFFDTHRRTSSFSLGIIRFNYAYPWATVFSFVSIVMGCELFKHSVRKHGTIYGSREACRTCPNRCTDSKNAKTVSIGHNTNIVAVRMYGNPEYPLQKLPKGFVPHNSIGRPQKPERVRLILRRNPDDMQRRKELVEHPFGTIKWYDGAHYFLCRGKEMVSAEIALSFLTYNLRRAIRILGVGALVAHFNARNQKNRG